MLKTWGKRLGRWLEKWGYALMCILCAAVILLSALWTRDAQREERLSMNAHSGMDETLKDREVQENAAAWVSPVSGDMMRGFSSETVYFEQTGVFSVHPALDFAADKETVVFCMAAGRVVFVGDGEVRITHDAGESVYRGLGEITCGQGQTLKAGDAIGTGGGYVPFEGDGHVCVSLWENGERVDFAPRLP